MNANRGSSWAKWDLHFHTPSSYDYNGSVTNHEIIAALATENVTVVAITDHHLIDIQRISELRQLGLEKGITVLPGIEFRSELGGSDSIHFIGIFPESSDLNHIWVNLQSQCGLTDKDIDAKGGNEAIYCDLANTCALVRELGGITTIHGGSKSNTVESIKNTYLYKMAQKTFILKDQIDVLELGKESDQSSYLEIVFPSIKYVLPMIICSDNHDIKNYQVKQSLWIKAEPTFEGLKQIIYEPELRVKIQKEEPDYKDERLVIDSVRFISSDNTFTPERIYLNRNLNVIIGGKSSGKSILLYCIAKTLLSDKDVLEKLRMADKYALREQDPTFNFEITTMGQFSQMLYRDESETSILPDLKYIPQNYLVELAEPELNKKGNALNKMVRELIKEDKEATNAYDVFLSEVKFLDGTRDNLIDLIFQVKDKIANLEADLAKRSSKQVLESNIKTNLDKVEELNKQAGLSEEEIKKFKNIQEESDENKAVLDIARADVTKVKDYNKEATGALVALKGKMEIYAQSLKTQVIKDRLEATYKEIEKLLQLISDFNNEVDTYQSDDKIHFRKEGLISQLIMAHLSKKEQIEKDIQPYLDNQEVSKQRESILSSIEKDKISISSIESLSKEISELKEFLSGKENELFAAYRTTFGHYLSVISSLKSRVQDLEQDGLQISGFAKFNYPKFREAMIGISDGRSASFRLYEICNEELNGLSEFEFEGRINEIKTIYKAIISGQYGLKRVDKKTALKSLFADYFFDYWEIEYKGDKLGKMSTGKACFVILMLIVGLSKSKGPILIDQPEDNLDNRSITSDLVTYLRSKKLERQIIVVTHNPNVVVNADAENIIVANQKGQSDFETNSPFRFDYINGALENSFPKNSTEKNLLKSMGIREHIAEIVEGGKEAFQKRERKYGFDE
jgi:hypothetical protein